MADEKSRELKVDVDVSKALVGLKAVQREARKATQALAEFERAANAGTIFTAGDNVRWDFETHGGLYQCICADRRTAVFAPARPGEDGGTHVEFRDMFAVSNDKTLESVIRGKYEKVTE